MLDVLRGQRRRSAASSPTSRLVARGSGQCGRRGCARPQGRATPTTRFGAMPHLPGSPAWQRNSSHSTVLDYHLSMLHDTARMDSFRRAIDASVQPGDVVVDIGCGSGVLSFMACEAGAEKVYAIEGGPVIERRPGAGHRQRVRRSDRVPRWLVDRGRHPGAGRRAHLRDDRQRGARRGDRRLDLRRAATSASSRCGAPAPAAPHVGRRRSSRSTSTQWCRTGGRPDLPYDYTAAHRRAARTLWFADLTPEQPPRPAGARRRRRPEDHSR